LPSNIVVAVVAMDQTSIKLMAPPARWNSPRGHNALKILLIIPAYPARSRRHHAAAGEPPVNA
jgi:hypothetical protein